MSAEDSRAWRPMRTAPRPEGANEPRVKILVATPTGPEVVEWRWNVLQKRYGWCGDDGPWKYETDPDWFWGWQPIDPLPKRKVM